MNHQQNNNWQCENVSKGDLRTSWDSTAVTDAMQASWFTCSVSEEDFIDNVQPNLLTASLTGSLSSNFTTDDTCVEPEVVLQKYCAKPALPLEAVPDSISNCSTSATAKESILDSAEDYLSRPDSPKSKLSLSLHDVSTIPSFPLTSKSSHFSSSTIQSQSMTTDASLPKSKDSGFPRSLSCLSLSSGRSYAHVQSKVKEYIRQIKEENEGRKAHKTSSCHIEQEPDDIEEESISNKKLLPIIDKLKDELEDKDKIILKMQENYDVLLTRYAAAEHRIDHLRVNSSEAGNSTPFKYDIQESRKSTTPANPNVLLIPELQGILNDSHSDFCKSYANKSSKQSPGLSKSSSKVLNPITKFCSSSNRLDKLGTQSSILKSDTGSIGCRLLNASDDRPKFSNRNATSTPHVNRTNLGIRNSSSTSIVKELSPERLNNQFAENPFMKVQRWQESLPSFELIEPSPYSSLNTNKSESLTGSSQQSKPNDQSFNISSNHDIDFATHEGNSLSTKNISSYLLSRSISQPNYVHTAVDSQSSPYQPSQHVGLAERSNLTPHLLARSLSLKVTEDPNVRTKHSEDSQPVCTNVCCRHRNLGLTENSHVSRKKLVGQKARLVLFEYLKKSSCNSSLYNISKSPKVLERMQQVTSVASVSKEEVGNLEGSYDDRDISLGNCLDEMNQCAQNLKGKSEAILQVLAKQLKDP